MTQDVLPAIVAGATRSAALREQAADRTAFRRAVEAGMPRGDLFKAALAAPGIRVIAECKRRSPSRGILRRAYDPVAIARGYAAAGAAAISVLTEPSFFDGAPEHLTAVRQAVEPTVLRKDFIVTDFQVDEARAIGADAVLLIVAALDDATLARLRRRAASSGLAALVEVHDHDELRRAIDAGADIVGVNSRDLKSLSVRLETFEALAPALPRGLVAVAESGLRTAADLVRLHTMRYDAFLIGERFMTDANPGAALGGMLADAARGGRAS